MSIEDNIEQDLKQTFGDKGANALRDTLAEVDSRWSTNSAEATVSQPHEAKVRSLSFRRVMSIAASFLVLAVAGWWVIGAGQSSDPNALYTEYIGAYDVSLTVRGTTDATAVQAAQSAYQAGEYGAAYSQFAALASQDPAAHSYAFYAGVAALLDGQAAVAIPFFKNLLAEPNHLFIEQSRWYLALSYLQEGDSASAKTILGEIGEDDFKGVEAKEVLGALE